jgi:hypothetical protein
MSKSNTRALIFDPDGKAWNQIMIATAEMKAPMIVRDVHQSRRKSRPNPAIVLMVSAASQTIPKAWPIPLVIFTPFEKIQE